MRRLLFITVISTFIAGCAASVQPSAGPPTRLRVLTYNIHIGIGMDKKLDLPRIAQVINQSGADVVALQELDRGTSRTGKTDQPAQLASLTGMHVAFAKTIDHMGGQYGIALLSRYPITDVKTSPLPCTPGREPRAALAASINPDGHEPCLLICTHLDAANDQQDSLQQVRTINELFVAGHTSAILAGDFNKPPQSATIHTLLAHWTNATHSTPQPTSPANHPSQQIDYVFYRPAGLWRVVEAKVIEEPVASDHRPLLVVLERAGERP